MADSFVDKKTPFKRFVARTGRSCNRCRRLVNAGDLAWKPSENVGSWRPSAVICVACANQMIEQAGQEP